MTEKEGSVQDLIENFLQKNKKRIVFLHKKGYRTYAVTGEELYDKTNKIRIFFKNKNIKRGDKIILFGWNYLEWIAVYFAAILSGVTAVPLDVLTDKTLLKKIKDEVKAKAIFQDRELASTNRETYYFDELDEILKKVKTRYLPRFKAEENDILEIMYTSGTTGEPKGVVLTYKNIAAGLSSATKSIPLNISLKLLNLLPLSHIFGQVYGLFLPMYFSYQLFFIDSMQPRKIISFIKNKRINSAILVPGILAALKKELEGKSVLANLGAQFRLIGVGGAPLDAELERWWKRKLIMVVQGYGLTETSSIAAVNRLFGAKTKSAGKIDENIKLKLGEDGEILVKGDAVTTGYYEDKEKTKQSFENGYFKTGDIGEIKNGYLYLKERKKDVIITGSGLKVYPVDIETILNKIDGVKESCVIEKDGKIHAILILNKDIDASEMIGKVNKKLLAHQMISNYSVWPETDFPRTPIGKIKKHIIEQEIGRAKGKKYSYEGKLYNLINNILKPHRKIVANFKLVKLGMDSLKRIELISEIENEFGVEVDEVKLDRNARVIDLEQFMKEGHVYRIKFRNWPLNPVLKALRFLFQKLLFFPLARAFTKTTYYGDENIKDIKTPVIFASNHQSALDGAVISKKLRLKTAIAADPDIVFGIGTKGSIFLKLFRKLLGYFTALFFNTYPFGTAIGTDLSLEFTGEMIDRGYSILIFPEAARTLDGKVHEFKLGIGYLALNMDVAVVPVKVEGLFEVLPRWSYIPKFGKSSVKFGKPIRIEAMSYIEAAKLIEKRVREL